jgi:hypothetical protein
MTDRHDEANNGFLQICKRAKKNGLKLFFYVINQEEISNQWMSETGQATQLQTS